MAGATAHACACANGGGEVPLTDSVSRVVASKKITKETATLPINSPQRMMVRTADLLCRVRDIPAAVTELESRVRATGGVVEESRTESAVSERQTSYYKADSMIENSSYNTTAYLTLRVPAAAYDSFMAGIPPLCTFIDNRSLKQEDVTLQFLSNEMHNEIAPRNGAAAPSSDVDMRRYDDQQQAARVDRLIENLKFNNNADYATVKLTLTQPAGVFSRVVVNTAYAMHPPLWLQCREALSNGWNVVVALFIALLSVWPLWLMAIPVVLVLRRYRRRRQFLAQA